MDDNTQYTNVEDYRKELIHTLSSAKQTALQSTRQAQGKYKTQYDKRTDSSQHQVGDWVVIRFPSEELGHFVNCHDLGMDHIG